jgi:adenylyltransferase/sulfurtransferase
MSVQSIKQKIIDTEAELIHLKQQLAKLELNQDASSDAKEAQPCEPVEDDASINGESRWPLTAEEYNRYGRQMIVPSIGIQGILYSFVRSEIY